MIESFKLPTITPETLTGSIVSFNDEYGGLPLKSCTSLISGYQEGSGTPSPDNVRPLHAFSSADLYFNTINQWDEQWELGILSLTDGSNQPSNANIRCKNYITVKGNMSYYVVLPVSRLYVFWYDSNKTLISYTSGMANTTTLSPANARYARFYCNSPYGTTYNNDISINYPSTDTSYHTFSGAVFTFGQTIYQGSIDWKRGVVVGTWVMKDLGALNWTKELNHFYSNIFLDAKYPPNNSTVADILCENYQAIAENNVANEAVDNSIGMSKTGRIYIYDSSLSSGDATAFTSAVTGVYLAYELATPIEIPIGGINLLTQQGQNNIYCDTGDTTLEWLKVN